jgi:1-acyl-sn-glycerol-3-phosphate acyltransferase
MICSLTLTEARVLGAEVLEDLPRPYVLMINHCSDWDPIVVWGYFPDCMNFMIKESLHRVPFFKDMSILAGNIPVRRDRNDFSALKQAIRHLRSGYNLAIFPEGTRSLDGRLQPFKEGAVSLAAKVRCPVVPVVVHGTYAVSCKNSFFLRSNPTEIHILQPRLEPVESSLTSEEIKSLTQEVHGSIANYQKILMK